MFLRKKIVKKKKTKGFALIGIIFHASEPDPEHEKVSGISISFLSFFSVSRVPDGRTEIFMLRIQIRSM